MYSALRRFGYEVTLIGTNQSTHSLFHKVKRRLYNLIGKHYDYERDPTLARKFSSRVQQALEQGQFDLVLSPSSVPLAYLNTQLPKVFWTDATFASLTNFYPGNWSRLSTETRKQGNALESLAIRNSDACFYASDWAAQSALHDYQGGADQVAVIPFGANLDQTPLREEVLQAIANRPMDICRLLFIGVEWHRKGGDLVIETASLLQAAGVNVRVDVVGCEPVGEMPDFVVKHGFISKATDEGRNKLKDLLLSSHFLFVPSMAECYGLVFAEAAAHGLPSLARAAGGIPTVVKNGVNGQTFSMEAGAQDYVDYVKNKMKNPAAYQDSAKHARMDFEERLNWDAAIQTFDHLVKPLMKSKEF